MATTETLRSISVGLEAIDEKKAQLRRAFEELQAHSSLIPSSSSSTSSFTNLKWADIDSYFTSLQSGLQAKFALLKSAKPVPEGPQPPPQPESAANIKSGSATSEPLPPQPESKAKRKASLSVPEPVPSAGPVPVRPELKSFCEKMDSFGLRDFLLARPRERAVIRDELADAWKHARDPAMLVVDAMQGITGDGSSGGVADVTGLRRVSVALLEALMRAKVEIGAQVKEKAMAIAVEWNRNIAAGVSSEGDDDGLEKLCFLQLVATFGLVENDLFNMNDLVEYAVAIARHRQAVDLCRVIGFGDRICDVITKLISGGKILVAVKFIFQFEQTEKFPPVPLLRGCISETKKIGQKARRTGGRSGKNFRQSWNEETAKAISMLKSVIKVIDEYSLDTVLPKNVLLRRVEKLENEKNTKKRPAVTPGVKSQPPSKQQKLSLGKQAMKVGTTGSAAFQKDAAASTTVQLIGTQPHAHLAGVFADPYLNTPASAYGLAGSAPAFTHHTGTSADMYGLPRTHMSLSGNLDRPVVYSSGYSYLPPEYHPAYYPQ